MIPPVSGSKQSDDPAATQVSSGHSLHKIGEQGCLQGTSPPSRQTDSLKSSPHVPFAGQSSHGNGSQVFQLQTGLPNVSVHGSLPHITHASSGQNGGSPVVGTVVITGSSVSGIPVEPLTSVVGLNPVIPSVSVALLADEPVVSVIPSVLCGCSEWGLQAQKREARETIKTTFRMGVRFLSLAYPQMSPPARKLTAFEFVRFH